MVLPNDVIEYIAGFADIDTRRALGFPPRRMRRSRNNLKLFFKKGSEGRDPHITLTVCGNNSVKNIVLTHHYDTKNPYYETELIKTILGGQNGTVLERTKL
jgi:hypothetical protein